MHTAAQLYDLIHLGWGKDYAAESDELTALIDSRAPDARTLLDVACGTGGHLAHLRRRFEVTGVDLDEGMLAVARSTVPEATLVEADMRTLSLGRTFDAVVCLFSSVGYLTSTAELDQAVSAMASHLAPGGVLVVDGWIRPDAWTDGSTFSDVASVGSTQVVRVSRSVREGRTTILEMAYLVATPDGIEHHDERHELTLFDDDAYRGAFRRAGLEPDVVASPMPGRDRYVATRLFAVIRR